MNFDIVLAQKSPGTPGAFCLKRYNIVYDNMYN
ncbi:MAG: hypothetical protein UX62_C0007G0009 [Microgenomates group bacterium GW2011_GWA2_46_7]|nr:MAG: hypothetical protein UX64_C0017G0003 [Microgenomates group bacterium GW2011_GWC2_46_7]KKU46812.1 MAG: hypothetical protein UX62_C0007G0009 [Microgenomates group bacterium GW2011_GWA2_46_7]